MRPRTSIADTLVLLYDGAVATAQMDTKPEAARIARHTAELVLDNTTLRTVRRRRRA